LDLLGLAAPRMSMSLKASVELDSENETLQAELAEAYSQALEEKERSSPTSGPNWRRPGTWARRR
jgi:hypothetical protein